MNVTPFYAYILSNIFLLFKLYMHYLILPLETNSLVSISLCLYALGVN